MAEKRQKKTVQKVKNPPEAPKPWHPSQLQEQGDPTPEPLYTAVGAALTQWEKLECVQADLYGSLVGSRRGAAVRGFGMIAASSTRATMVIAAAEAVLSDDEELLTETVRLLKDIGELSARRNEIAHGVVSNPSGTRMLPDWTVEPFDQGHFLMPAYYAARYRNPKERDMFSPLTETGKYAYTASQVMNFAVHFAEHYSRLVTQMFKVISYCDTKWPAEVVIAPASQDEA